MNDCVYSQNRLDWLDATKAIGLIFVYIGHCNIPGVNVYIYMFHMPLFFIISGFCWNTEKNGNMELEDFFRKKFERYMIPYFKICFVCFTIFTLYLGYKSYGLSTEWGRDILKRLFAVLIYSRGTTDWLPNCSPVWFLSCLFSAEMMFFYIMKRNRPYLYVVAAGCIGYAMSLIGKVFPWNIDNAFSAIPLLYVGILFRRYWLELSKTKYLFALIPIALLTNIYGITGVDFDGNRFTNILAMYFQSSVISLALLSLCKNVFESRWKCLSQFGRDTIILLGYNYAINTLLLYKMPFIWQTWVMAVLVIIMGGMLVLFLNRVHSLKKILV